jgi:broad specificity phosphatase PhoE
MSDAPFTDVYLTRHGETTWNVEQPRPCSGSRNLGGTAPFVVSHAGIGRMSLRNLLDLPVYEALGLPQPHCLVRHVYLRGRIFTDLE